MMKYRKNCYRHCYNCEHLDVTDYDGILFCGLKHGSILFPRLKALFCTKYIDNRGDTE